MIHVLIILFLVNYWLWWLRALLLVLLVHLVHLSLIVSLPSPPYAYIKLIAKKCSFAATCLCIHILSIVHFLVSLVACQATNNVLSKFIVLYLEYGFAHKLAWTFWWKISPISKLLVLQINMMQIVQTLIILYVTLSIACLVSTITSIDFLEKISSLFLPHLFDLFCCYFVQSFF